MPLNKETKLKDKYIGRGVGQIHIFFCFVIIDFTFLTVISLVASFTPTRFTFAINMIAMPITFAMTY